MYRFLETVHVDSWRKWSDRALALPILIDRTNDTPGLDVLHNRTQYLYMLELVQRHGAVIGMEKQANNRVNSDCQNVSI